LRSKLRRAVQVETGEASANAHADHRFVRSELRRASFDDAKIRTKRDRIFVDAAKEHVRHSGRADFRERENDDGLGRHALHAGRGRDGVLVLFVDDARDFRIGAFAHDERDVVASAFRKRAPNALRQHQRRAEHEGDERDAKRCGGSRAFARR
jgi:hypothetical protein